MFDIRYHWLTLAALFFALGLGILVGSSLGERGLVSREQERLAAQLEAGLAKLREENRALRQAAQQLERELGTWRDTAELLARVSIVGRLAGHHFVLVEGTGTGRWQALLEAAGATVERRASFTEAAGGAEALVAATTEQEDSPHGVSPSAHDGPRVAIYVNPPPNMFIPEGWRGAVVWDRDPGDQRGGVALPSDWLALRTGEGPWGEWALVEGLRQGWRGYVDASAVGGRLQARIRALVEQGVDGGAEGGAKP